MNMITNTNPYKMVFHRAIGKENKTNFLIDKYVKL